MHMYTHNDNNSKKKLAASLARAEPNARTAHQTQKSAFQVEISRFFLKCLDMVCAYGFNFFFLWSGRQGKKNHSGVGDKKMFTHKIYDTK